MSPQMSPQMSPPSLTHRNPRPVRENDVGTVGIVGDVHAPFTVDGYLEFCAETFVAWGVDRVIFIGDLVDHHACSFHQTDADGYSAGDEFYHALAALREWYDTFDSAIWILGNHDKIPARQAFAAGLPAHFLRDNIYETPDGWITTESAVLDDVLYVHGGGKYASGQYGHRHLAQRRAQSCVIGHNHYYGGTYYLPLQDGRQIFGLQVGCGLDHRSYAMAYCKDDGPPALGCGIVVDGETALFQPMLR